HVAAAGRRHRRARRPLLRRAARRHARLRHSVGARRFAEVNLCEAPRLNGQSNFDRIANDKDRCNTAAPNFEGTSGERGEMREFTRASRYAKARLAGVALGLIATAFLVGAIGTRASSPASSDVTVPAKAGQTATASWTGTIAPGSNPTSDC